MVKKVLTIVAVLISTFLLLWFADVHFLRGYYFNFLTFKFIDQDINVTTKKMKYTITPSSNGMWRFRIENNDFAYRFFIAYRDDIPIFGVTDSIIFKYATRGFYYLNGKKIFEDTNFDCGTGLAPILIRPFESFEYESNTYDLLKFHTWNYFTFVAEKYMKSIKDSVTIKLFFPVNGFPSDSTKRVFSNTVKLSYDDWHRNFNTLKEGYLN